VGQHNPNIEERIVKIHPQIRHAPREAARRGKRLRIIVAGFLVAFLSSATLILANPLRQEQVPPWNNLSRGYTVVMLATVVFLVFCSLLFSVALLTREPARMKRRLGKYIVLILSSMIAVGTLDLVLSLFPSLQSAYNLYSPHNNANWIPDNALGFRFKPDQRLSWRFNPVASGGFVLTGQVRRPLPTDEKEFDVYFNTDADGFFNDSVPTQADMVVIGDSFTVGMHVPANKGWASLLEKQLPLTVYNAGVNAYGPPQELVVLKKYGLPKRPRIVLWGFCQGNDLADAEAFDAFKHGKHTYVFVPASEKPFPYNRPVVKLLMALRECYWRLERPVYPDPQRLSAGGVEKPIAFSNVTLYQLARSREEIERSLGWKLTCEALVKAKKACDEAGTRLVIAYFPVKLSVYGDYALDKFNKEKILEFARPRLKELKDLTAEQLIEALRLNADTIARMLKDLCDANNIEFINTQPALEKSLERGEWPYYSYDGHWNVTGERVVAARIASYLKSHPDSDLTPREG
jgi:hypothetical protein